MFCFIYMVLLEYFLRCWVLDVGCFFFFFLIADVGCLFPYISTDTLWCLQYRLPEFKLSSSNYLIIPKKTKKKRMDNRIYNILNEVNTDKDN